MFDLSISSSKPNSPKAGLPPPPYSHNQSSSSLILAETTTTEVVTTTTTRFLLTPRKRREGSTGTQGPHVPVMSPSGRLFTLNKDLPPTPPETVLPFPSTPEPPVIASPTRTSSSASSLAPAEPNDTRTPATHVLAQASLSLGIPHTIPRASPTAQPRDIMFAVSAPSPDSAEPRQSLGGKRKKSSPNLRAQSAFARPSPDAGADQLTSRRSRGISLGPASFFGFGNSEASSSKSAQKPKETRETGNGSKTLTRRASFWTRKKGRPSTDTPPPEDIIPVPQLPDSSHLPPVLPGFPPISPFTVELASARSRPAHHARGLSRSNSDHAAVPKSSRPRTADSTAALSPRSPRSPRSQIRPTTADPVNRAFSMFEASPGPLLTSSPLPSPAIQEHPPSPLPVPSPPQEVPAPRRPRSSTNPPFLNRLSMSLFSSPSLPLRMQDGNRSLASSPATESPRASFQRPSSSIPKPEMQNESPEFYLQRLQAAVSKSEVAGILASSTDPFHVRALRSYIEQFDFSKLPLDVALRRLLMDVGLPRETQQIDRVMEAFAARFSECNPNLFSSDDHPYILAFSLIMLHTDAFNKSNKKKMTKADYIKNTRLPGISPEVLDYFYDNIVFTPFIFVEDPFDVNGQQGLAVSNERRPSTSRMLFSTSTDTTTAGSPGLLTKAPFRTDPYFLISQGLLDPLRVNVEQFVPIDNPYLYTGTADAWDVEEVRHSFTNAMIIEVTNSQSVASPFFALNATGAPNLVIGSSLVTSPTFIPSSNHFVLRVTKVGTLERKDDFLVGGKKSSNRRWRSWSVVLTGSQMLLFRDATWVDFFAAQLRGQEEAGATPRFDMAMFKPDELLSVKDAVAVYDRGYKHPHTFRFARSDGRHVLFRACDDDELNSWISRINYASAFKTAGVRMRSSGMSKQDIHLTGIAAATSHLHDMQVKATPSRSQLWDNNVSKDLLDMLSTPLSSVSQRRSIDANTTDRGSIEELGIPIAPEVDGAAQFEQTFDEVKAELASGRWTQIQEASPQVTGKDSIQEQAEAFQQQPLPPSSRASIVSTKVDEVKAKLSASHGQLANDMRFLRNIAILTPFQQSTHDRLVQATQNMSSRVMHVRLEIAKLACHLHTLRSDLEAERRDCLRSKTLALQVATETLQTHLERGLPKMTVSVAEEMEEQGPSQSRLPSRLSGSSSRREPSICESFHSALEFGVDWPLATDDPDSSGLLASALHQSTESHIGSSATSLPSKGTNASSPSPSFDAGSPSPQRESVHEKFFTAVEGTEEEAEQWDKTRCAQRVSLVRWPSGHRFSTLLQRHIQPYEETAESSHSPIVETPSHSVAVT